MTSQPAASPLAGARYPYWLASLGLIVLGTVLAAQVAVRTRFNAHPDEINHIEAFCYFRNRWLPPPLNSPEVPYDWAGQSRVYSREVVYPLYGHLRAALARLSGAAERPTGAHCEADFRAYRLLNVGLLAVTLAVIFAVGVRRPWAAALGVLMLVFPQVIYVYGYANSDAFALSACLGLMLFALTQRRPLASLPRALLLGALTALVILSKSAYWVTLFFAYGLMGWQALRRRRGLAAGPSLALAAVVLTLIAPLRIWYPWRQGPHFTEQVLQMMEEHALPEFKPSQVRHPTYRLRDKGIGFAEMLLRYPWLRLNAMSFYGLFGYMNTPSPAPAYALALGMLAANGLLSGFVARQRWPTLPHSWKMALALGVLMSLGGALAAAYYSWVWDFQPQGRYLFPLLVPLALWLGGTWAWEAPAARAFRLVSAAAMLALAAGLLWTVVITNPTL